MCRAGVWQEEWDALQKTTSKDYNQFFEFSVLAYQAPLNYSSMATSIPKIVFDCKKNELFS